VAQSSVSVGVLHHTLGTSLLDATDPEDLDTATRYWRCVLYVYTCDDGLPRVHSHGSSCCHVTPVVCPACRRLCLELTSAGSRWVEFLLMGPMGPIHYNGTIINISCPALPCPALVALHISLAV
jgi:hypothetical protein